MAALELNVLTRREWLLGSLSLAVGGASACARGGRIVLLRHGEIAGGFAGPDVGLGHLIRDGGWRGLPMAARRRTEVAILGGGVAGLSAAWALSRAGMDDFTVLELEAEAGGTARSGQARTPGAAIPYPWGAHYVPVPAQSEAALCRLLTELSVITGFDAAGRAICAEEYLCRAPQERIFHKGRWYEGLYLRAGASAEDLRQLDRFQQEVGRWVRARGADGRRAFTLPQARGDRLAGGAGALDQMSMAAYLDGLGLNSRRLRWQVDYGCRDDFGLREAQTSAWAGMHYHAARLLHPDDRSPEVLTWPEGNGWLVRRLLERIEGAAGPDDGAGPRRVRTGCAVAEIRPLPDGTVELIHTDGPVERGVGQGEAGGGRGENGRGHANGRGPVRMASLIARHVIYALPAFLRRPLIAPWRNETGDALGFLDAFTYAPWLVANLTLRRTDSAPVALGANLGRRDLARMAPGYPPCWDNVLVDSPSLGYVSATHQREPAPPADGIPRTVWTYYLPLCGPDPRVERARLLNTSWQTYCDFILSDLQKAEPDLPGQVERIDIFRWGHGMVRPVPGLLTGGALSRAAEPFGNIHFAHTDLSGMALFEEAQDAGVRAAQEVMARRGHPFEDLR